MTIRERTPLTSLQIPFVSNAESINFPGIGKNEETNARFHDRLHSCPCEPSLRGHPLGPNVRQFRQEAEIAMNQVATILKNNLPFGRHIRALKRALVGYQGKPENDEGLLDDATEIAAALHTAGAQLAGSTVVEIGTGWVPMLPLVFRMAGASEVITVDQNSLMDRSTFTHGISYIRDNLEFILNRAGRDLSLFNRNRLPDHGGGQKLSDLCRSAGITYMAPLDFMELKPGTCDYIVSRAVLEHIPEDVLRNIFRHAATVMRPGGMMCHWIDMSDHFEHSDKSISRVDLLRYDDDQWRTRTIRPEHYQNRLRRFEYIKLLEETGWEVVAFTGKPHAKSLEDLKGMEIKPPYTSAPHEELAVLVSMVIARRTA